MITKRRIRQNYGGGNFNKKNFGVLPIIFLVFCSFFLASCVTPTPDAKYRQIVIATGSPFELGLVTELV